jgi:uncharacterized membrane protein YhiD involved in acid resistance
MLEVEAVTPSQVFGLVLAAVLGGVIGLERDVRGQSAGLRTHMVLSLGSALAAEVSVLYSTALGGGADPGRIVGQVVSGLGFLGAGAIIRYGSSVKGLTTAASLWTTAIIGIACGSGFGPLAAVGAALTLGTLWVVGHFERRFLSSGAVHTIDFTLPDRPGVVRDLLDAVVGLGVRVVSSSASVGEGPSIRVSVVVQKPNDLTIDKIIGIARRDFGASSVRVE